MADYKLLPYGVQRQSDMMGVPPVDGNSDWDLYREWVEAGGTPDPADPIPSSSPEPRLVPKRWIIDRLHEAGKLEAALAALNAADIYTQQRWASRDSIYFNDPTLLASLKAIGADPDMIMAE